MGNVNVGGVSITLDGDASGAVIALEAAAKKVDELKIKERDLAAALDAAMSSCAFCLVAAISSAAIWASVFIPDSSAERS